MAGAGQPRLALLLQNRGRHVHRHRYHSPSQMSGAGTPRCTRKMTKYWPVNMHFGAWVVVRLGPAKRSPNGANLQLTYFGLLRLQALVRISAGSVDFRSGCAGW